AATGVEVKSATEVKATSPAHAAGEVDVTVTTPGGTSTTGAGDKFTYVSAPAEFSLTIATAGTGSGTVKCKVNGGSATTCAAKYTQGTSIELVQSSNAGSKFAGWSGDCSGSGACKLTMTAAKGVTATFNKEVILKEFSLEIAKEGTGSGTVTSSPAGIDCGGTCAASFAEGEQVKLTATPDEGSEFKRWFGVEGSCAFQEECATVMGNNKTVKAMFTAVGKRKLTVKKAGTGTGTVISSPSGINCGSICIAEFGVLSKVTLTATAASGSSFAGWSGACTGTGACKVTMSEARNVTATFDAPPPPPPPGNGLAVIGGTVKIKKGKKALLRVLCNGPSSCKGTVKLLIRAKLSGKTKTVTAGSADFKLEPGASITVTIQLSRKARQLLDEGKQVQGRVTGTGLHPHGVRLKLV
ncbi:MAG TPA: InlB B-repeat-containing protein, partial [Solirubrobacterales bacterium]